MWQAVRFSLLLLSAAGLLMMENTPSGLRDNICSWEIVYPCPEWFGTSHVDGALLILVWLLIVGLSSSLIIPFVLADYRRTIAFMAVPVASAMPSGTNFLGGQAEPQNEAHDFALADLDEWRKVDPLQLWRAGCLWKGYKPHYPIPFVDPVYASFIMLVNAAIAGQLTVTNPGTKVDAWSRATRIELARFARSKGEMPEFLRDIGSEIAVEPLSPDWSMKELCQHVLDNISDSEEVIREIEAKARLGVLACWGRKFSALKANDNPNPLRPILPEHWDDFSLDYLRCVMHEDPAECCTEPRGLRGDHTESYQDLQVNRHQSMSIWPIKSE